ncbi:CbbBc protein, partial [Rhizobium ruizarguesonis]
SAFDRPSMISSMASTALVCLGGNIAVAIYDPEATFAGMRKLDLAVHLATKPNRSQLLIARTSIILPVLGRTDQDIQTTGPQSVTVED